MQVAEASGTVAVDPTFVTNLCRRHALAATVCAALPRRLSAALQAYLESPVGDEAPPTGPPYSGKAAHHLHLGGKVAADAEAERLAEQKEGNADHDGGGGGDDDDDEAFDDAACREARLQFAFAARLNPALRADGEVARGMGARLASAGCPPKAGGEWSGLSGHGDQETDDKGGEADTPRGAVDV